MHELIGHKEQAHFIPKFFGVTSNFSFLITGPRQSGKTFFGKYLASRILNSEKVFRDSHPDFYYFRPSSTYQDSISAFSEAVFKKPFESKSLVVFFDDIHLIPAMALNKILKIIEEPPALSTVVLSATSLDSVLSTIVSRCFKVNLSPFSFSEKVAVLANFGIQDGPKRLRIIDDLRTCASRDFDSIVQRIKANRGVAIKLFNSETLIQSIFDIFPSIEDKLDLFFKDLLGWSDDVELNALIATQVEKISSSANRFVTFVSFIHEVRHGYQGSTKVLKE